MEKFRPSQKTAPRGKVLRTALVYCSLTVAACSGVEADVLSLRPVPDLAVVASDGPAPEDGAVPSCTTQTLSTQGCVDLAVWFMKAQAICSSLGLLSGPLVLTASCSSTTGQGVHFECCPTPTCTPLAQGDDMSCRDAKTWLDSATLDCQSRGAQVTSLALIEPCAVRRYRLVKYLCCTAPVTPPLMP